MNAEAQKKLDWQLYKAVRKADIAKAEELVAQGANVNGLCDPWWVKYVSPLYAASDKSNYGMIKWLLEKGANPNLRTCPGGRSTPFLWFAEFKMSPQILDLFLAYGADPRMKNEKGKNVFDLLKNKALTPKLLAAVKKLEECERAAAEEKKQEETSRKDAPLSIKEENAAKKNEVIAQQELDRFLTETAIKGDVAYGIELISVGADVNSRLGKGMHTALSQAAFNGHIPFMKMLLEKGAQIDLKSDNGYTPRDWAIKKEREEAVKFLDDWKKNIGFSHLARDKNIVVVVSELGTRTLEETFNFAARERISVVCARPGAPAETLLRESFDDIADLSGVEKAFKVYKEYGGTLIEEDVFPSKIVKITLPRPGGKP